MKNTKPTTYAFISSIISIFLCVVVFIGSTFAWYSDEASVSVDDIRSAKIETTTEETTTEESTTEKVTEESTTENLTTESTTEESTTQETTVEESTTESTTEETTTEESTTEEETTAESTTEESTTQEEPAQPDVTEGPKHIIDGNEFDENSKVVYEAEKVEAESYLIVRKSVDEIYIKDVYAVLSEDAIVLEEGCTVIIIENSDFTVPNGRKLISNDSKTKDITIILRNVTVNGEKLDDNSANKYFKGVSEITIES